MTDAGDLDIRGTPVGTSGYEELAANAVRLDLGTVEVEVASLDDFMAMKRASGRPRDRADLEILAAIRDEVDQSKRAPT